jgi:PAS domain S-box-containing protein
MSMVDHAGRIVSLNTITEKLLGYELSEIEGKSYSTFFSKQSQHRKKFAPALAIATKKGNSVTEAIFLRKDGSHFWGRLTITAVRNNRNNRNIGLYFVFTLQDISREKALESRQQEYVGIASHELKNPITTLSLYSELLERRLQLHRDKKNLGMLHDIQAQAGRLLGLIDDLLIVSKLGGGTFELHKTVFNPDVLIRKVIKDFKNSATKHRIIYRPIVRKEVLADQERIAQVLINLLTNAIKYSPLATKIVVHAKCTKGKYIISIQDFGPGITALDQRHIFSRFFRTRDVDAGNISGSGLGLYISREIIQKHRGTLSVKSSVGKGTTFSFTLTLARRK